MPSSNTENYARIVLIIANCGTLLTKKLFEKRVKDLFPNDTISGFLDEHKTEIGKAEKHIQRTLFPRYGEINIQKWDLTIFCFLLQMCNLEKINKCDIQKLKDMRNDIYHLPKPSLSVSEFQSRIVEINTIFERTCNLIDDEVFKKEFSEIFARSKNDMDFVKELVKRDREMVKRENCWFKLIAEKQEEILIRIEENHAEHSGLLQTIVSRVGRIESRLDTTSLHVLEYPENQIEIQFRNCPTDREKTLSDLLTELFMNEIHGDHVNNRNTFSETEINILQDAIRKTAQQMIAKGRPVSNAVSHCVLLTINCNSLSSLTRFMNDSLNGSLCYDFQDLLVAVRSITGFKETTFQIVIKEDHLLTSLEKVVDVLDSFEPETGIRKTVPVDNGRSTDESAKEIISQSPGIDKESMIPAKMFEDGETKLDAAESSMSVQVQRMQEDYPIDRPIHPTEALERLHQKSGMSTTLWKMLGRMSNITELQSSTPHIMQDELRQACLYSKARYQRLYPERVSEVHCQR